MLCACDDALQTVGGNSTVTIAGSLVAGEGITADQVYSWLADNSQNNDLCTIQYEYDPPSTATQGLCTDTQFPNIFYVAPAAPGTNGARRLLQVYGRLPASQVVLSKSWRSL